MSSMYCIGSLLSEGRFRDYDERDRRESTSPHIVTFGRVPCLAPDTARGDVSGLVIAVQEGAVDREELARGHGRSPAVRVVADAAVEDRPLLANEPAKLAAFPLE